MFLVRYASNILCDAAILVRSGIGRGMRQAGLQLDAKGSKINKDIAYLEHFNRHRNIMPCSGQIPQISGSAYIAPNATIYGDVYAGQNSYFAFGCVVRGDANAIRIGENTKIGQNTVLKTNPIGADLAFPLSVNIGNNVNIEHSCSLISCIIDDDVHIGHRTVIQQGCQLQRGCVIAPNSFVPAGSRIAAHTVWGGNPVRYIGEVNENDKNKLEQNQNERIRFID